MKWDKEEVYNEKNQLIEMQAPVIISASRSTDIPAFYSDWFCERLKQGYLVWKNPFNGNPLHITFKKARAIVFWSKNPKPMINDLDFISTKIPNYYFQFTLNDYENEGLEENLPPLQERIDTFIELSKKIGKEKVIWRFDPLVLLDDCNVDNLIEKIENIGNQIHQYTNKLVFSFADISIYRKVKSNLDKAKINYIEFTEELMIDFAKKLNALNQKWVLELATCAEKNNLKEFNIEPNKCVDDDLLIELFHKDKDLMDFLNVEIAPMDIFSNKLVYIKKKNNKDKGQRELCGCIISKDIGEYNTCTHGCLYCYANTSLETAQRNYENHLKNPHSETITGR